MLLSRGESAIDGAYTDSTSEAVCISGSVQAKRLFAPPHLECHTLALLAPGVLPSVLTELVQEWGSTQLGEQGQLRSDPQGFSSSTLGLACLLLSQ